MTGGGHGCSTLRPAWGRAGMRLPCMVIVLSLLACRTLSLVSNFPANSPLQSMASALGSAGASLHLSRRSTPSRLLIFRSDGEYVAQESSKRRQRRKGWHRVVTRFLRRRQNSDDYAVDDRVRASSPMHMSLQTEQDLVDPRLPLFMDKVENDTDFSGFIRAGFSSLTPQELMIDLHHHQNSTADPLDRMKDKRPVDETAVPSVSGTSSAGIYGSISLDALSPEKLGTTVRPAQSPLDSSPQPSYFDPTLPNRKRSTKKREFWARMTQKWFRNFLLGIIHRRSVVPPHGLAVEAHTRGRFGGLNSLGQFRCDATIQFDRVTFPNIRLSGGGTLMTKRLLVNLLAFGNNSWSSGRPRYERPFEIIATNCTFTEDDLWASSCIRNGLSNLLVRILNNAGVSTVQVKVTAVKILPSNKISCSGEATIDFGTGVVPFEVRSGLGTACRGHVLTFPCLEVSLNPMLGFIPIIPDVNLDIGHNARLLHVELDHRRRRATVSASTTITPNHTRRLRDYVQHSDSYFAQFTFDVGRWVTEIGGFGK